MMDDEVFCMCNITSPEPCTCVRDQICSGVHDTTRLRKMRVRRSSSSVVCTTFADVCTRHFSKKNLRIHHFRPFYRWSCWSAKVSCCELEHHSNHDFAIADLAIGCLSVHAIESLDVHVRVVTNFVKMMKSFACLCPVLSFCGVLDLCRPCSCRTLARACVVGLKSFLVCIGPSWRHTDLKRPSQRTCLTPWRNQTTLMEMEVAHMAHSIGRHGNAERALGVCVFPLGAVARRKNSWRSCCRTHKCDASHNEDSFYVTLVTKRVKKKSAERVESKKIFFFANSTEDTAPHPAAVGGLDLVAKTFGATMCGLDEPNIEAVSTVRDILRCLFELLGVTSHEGGQKMLCLPRNPVKLFFWGERLTQGRGSNTTFNYERPQKLTREDLQTGTRLSPKMFSRTAGKQWRQNALKLTKLRRK